MKVLKVSLFVFLIAVLPKLSFAEKVFSFEGTFDLTKQDFHIVLDLDEGSSLTAQAKRMSETNYHLSLDIEHLKTPLFDLLSEIEGSVDLVADAKRGINPFDTDMQGKIWSQYSLVDYKPINELSGRFEIKDQRLHVMALAVGNLTFDGYLDLVAPYNLDGTVNLSGVGMKDFLNFWGSEIAEESDGDVFGEIKATGSLAQLALKGNLEGRNGFVQKLDFNRIVLNAEGIYPRIQIAQSTIFKADGVSFSFDGPFDLSDKENFRKQIMDLTLAPIVSDSGSELEWTIKSFKPEDSGTTELKYQLKRGDALGAGSSAGEEIDMLGIERSNKF